MHPEGAFSVSPYPCVQTESYIFFAVSDYGRLVQGLPWTHLRKLTLRFRLTHPQGALWDGSLNNSWIWTSLADILKHLNACPELRSVVMQMTEGIPADELRVDRAKEALGEIDSIVAGFRRAAALSMSMAPGYPPLTAEHRAIFESRMPLLHEARRLRVQ